MQTKGGCPSIDIFRAHGEGALPSCHGVVRDAMGPLPGAARVYPYDESKEDALDLDAAQKFIENDADQIYTARIPHNAPPRTRIVLTSARSDRVRTAVLGGDEDESSGDGAFDVGPLLTALRKPMTAASPEGVVLGYLSACARSAPPSPAQLAGLFGSVRLSFYAADAARGVVASLSGGAGNWLDAERVVAAAAAVQPMVRADVLRILLGALETDDARRRVLERVALPRSEVAHLESRSPRLLAEGRLT